MRMTVLVWAALVQAAGFAQEAQIETVVQRGHTDAIRVVKFSRDGRFFITASDDKTIKLWDVRLLREIRTFKGHEYAVKVALVNAEDNTLVSASGDTGSKTDILVWDLETGKTSKSIETGTWTFWKIYKGTAEMSFALQCLDMNKDGETLAWGEDNYGIRIGNTRNKLVQTILPTNWHPNAIAFSPDGKTLVAGAKEKSKRVNTSTRELLFWDWKKEKLIRSLAIPFPEVTKVSYSADGQFLAYQMGDTARQEIAVRDMTSDREVYHVSGRPITNCFAFAPNADFLAVPVSGGTIEIHSLKTKGIVRRLTVDDPEIFAVEFSPDSKLLLATGRKITAWSTSEWSMVEQIQPPVRIDLMEFTGNEILSAYKKNNQTLYTLDFGTLDFKAERHVGWLDFKPFQARSISSILAAEGNSIYSYEDGRREQKLFAGPFTPLSSISKFSSDNHSLLIQGAFETKALYYDIQTSTWFPLEHRKDVTSIAMSEDWLLTGDEDNKIHIWDRKTHARTKELLGHNNYICSMAIDPKQTTIASASNDDIKLWDLRKGIRVASFKDHTSRISDMTFDPTGTHLTSVTGDPDIGGQTEIIQWDLKKLKPQFKTLGNDGYVSKVLYHPTKNYFLTIGNDPIIRAWDAGTGAAQFGIVPMDSIHYIIYTHDNYYTFTKGQRSPVHFVRGTKIFLLENFDLRYNRPDIILERLGSQNERLKEAYRKVYLRRLRKLNYTEEMVSGEFHTPDIEIINRDSVPVTTSQTSLKLNLKMSDRSYPLERLLISVNNIPVFGSSGLKIANKGKSLTQLVEIPLSAGRNKITVSCMNAKGAESIKEDIAVFAGLKPRKPNLYIIAACVANYGSPDRNLKYSVKDGHDFVSLFKAGKEYEHVIVDSLFDANVTAERFLSLRKKLLKTHVDDHVILMMAGHGILDANFEFYFATHDIDFAHPARKGISFSDIDHLMDSIPARNKLVLIDACHSGEVDHSELEEQTRQYAASQTTRDLKVQSFDKLKMNVYKHLGFDNTSVELMQELFTNLRNGSGTVVISAAAGNSYALESDVWQNGVFTYSIKEALVDKQADINRDGRISAGELQRYVSRRVSELTAGNQKPTTRNENLEFDFTVMD